MVTLVHLCYNSLENKNPGKHYQHFQGMTTSGLSTGRKEDSTIILFGVPCAKGDFSCQRETEGRA